MSDVFMQLPLTVYLKCQPYLNNLQKLVVLVTDHGGFVICPLLSKIHSIDEIVRQLMLNIYFSI